MWIQDYNANTSLHGLKYITGESNAVARFIWLIVVISAISFGAVLTTRIIKKWQSSPIITSVDDTNYPVTKILFPAVTICPNFKGKMILQKNSSQIAFLFYSNSAVFKTLARSIDLILDSFTYV